MAEENSTSPEETPKAQAEGEAGASAASSAGESAEPQAELSGGIEARTGLSPDEELGKLRPICSLADQSYSQVLSLVREIKSSETTLQRFHAGDAEVTPADVDEAKKSFDRAKQSYIQLGNQINEGIKHVYLVAKTYPEDYLVQEIYKTYLAKLLASLETRNPIKPFVEVIATGGFEFEREEIVLTDEENQHKKTVAIMEKERLEEIGQTVVKLECRYQKRQLANRMKQGETPEKAIEQLTAIVAKDPEDINTYIWLANLISGELKKERDQNERMTLRDAVLDHCEQAFAGIDDYLALQMIENLNERDRVRAEYLKTITSIRKPLVNQ